MQPNQTPARRIASIVALFFAGGALAVGQTTNPNATDPSPTPGSAVGATASGIADETIQLDPFTVNTSEGQESYQVNETLAGARVRTNLRDVGSAISVLSSKFLNDIGATNTETLLQYTTNTEVGGIYGNFAGLGNSGQLTEANRLLRPNNDTR